MYCITKISFYKGENYPQIYNCGVNNLSVAVKIFEDYAKDEFGCYKVTRCRTNKWKLKRVDKYTKSIDYIELQKIDV